MYDQGFSGAIWEQEHFDEFVSTLKYPLFGDADSMIRNSGKGQLSTPFKSVLKFDPKAYEERQTTGDCVSHSTRNGSDLSRAVEIHVKGESEGWVTRGATEAIYGCRGHGGQGMSCSRATQFVSKMGGIVLRKNYPGIADLSKYKSSIGTKWGTRGVPESLKKIADDNQVKTTSLIKTVDQARDALANGYGISVCSGYGFSNNRDSKGFARKSGSWNHAMCWTACDDTGSEPAFLVQNSWGKWNSGGHPAWGPIPDGSFLIHADIAASMLRGSGAYAYSNVDGFPPQKLPNYGFESYL
jgi:hypothetical protein